MAQYAFRDGDWYDKKTGEKLSYIDSGAIACPMVVRDMAEHQGPSGRMVSGRAAFREECARTGSVPYDRGLRGDVREYIDPRPAAAIGRRWTPEAGERMEDARRAAFAAAALNDDGSPKEIVLTR